MESGNDDFLNQFFLQCWADILEPTRMMYCVGALRLMGCGACSWDAGGVLPQLPGPGTELLEVLILWCLNRTAIETENSVGEDDDDIDIGKNTLEKSTIEGQETRKCIGYPSKW